MACAMCLALSFVLRLVFHGLLLRSGGLMWVSESTAYLNRGFMGKGCCVWLKHQRARFHRVTLNNLVSNYELNNQVFLNTHTHVFLFYSLFDACILLIHIFLHLANSHLG